MKNLILIAFFSLSFLVTKAQSQTTNSQDTTIYTRVDVQPQYPGGFKAITEYIKKNLNPGTDQGMVFTSFVVERDGSLNNIKVVKHLSANADMEAVRLISTFPRFIPAKKDDKVVRCAFTMPIRF